MYLWLVTLALLASANCRKENDAPAEPEYREAMCYLKPNEALDYRVNNVQGVIHLYQERYGYHALGPLQFKIDIVGLARTKTDLHGFHAHSLNNFTKGCDSTGGHFNPFEDQHGAPSDEIRHVGDFGNLKADENGEIRAVYHDYRANIFEGQASIVGRPLVLHEGEDDLGRGGDDSSLANGNAGKRLACCLIVEATAQYTY